MGPALDPAGYRVPRTKPTCLLHTWRPHRRRPFSLVLHLHQHQSSRNLHLQYLAKNQSTQHCQSLITQGSGHPPVLEPHMVLNYETWLVYLQKITGHTKPFVPALTKASTYIVVHYINGTHAFVASWRVSNLGHPSFEWSVSLPRIIVMRNAQVWKNVATSQPMTCSSRIEHVILRMTRIRKVHV
jgi:hypothetical protein